MIIKQIKERLYFLKGWYQKVFLYPKEKIEIEKSLDYDEYWKKKLAERTLGLSFHEKTRADIVLSQVERGVVTISDIASGPGVILKYMIEKNRNISGVCYDISEYALKIARENGMETEIFDITNKENLKNIKPSDYFLFLEILEHIPHSEVMLNAAYEKAEKGVFFSFPNSGFFLYRLRLLFGKSQAQWVNFPNEHLRFWTNRDLKWWLGALGYKNYHITYYQGIRILRDMWPSMFAGSFVVFIKK